MLDHRPVCEALTAQASHTIVFVNGIDPPPHERRIRRRRCGDALSKSWPAETPTERLDLVLVLRRIGLDFSECPASWID